MVHRQRARMVLVIALSLASISSQGHADIVFSGSCLFSLTVRFSPAATYTSVADADVELNGSGTCVTDAEPLDPIKTVNFVAEGTALTRNCAVFEADGFYLMDFEPAPGPPSSAGTFVLAGGVAAVNLELVGGNPLLVGVAPLAGLNTGPAISCGAGGATTFTYLGTLTFTDP